MTMLQRLAQDNDDPSRLCGWRDLMLTRVDPRRCLWQHGVTYVSTGSLALQPRLAPRISIASTRR